MLVRESFISQSKKRILKIRENVYDSSMKELCSEEGRIKEVLLPGASRIDIMRFICEGALKGERSKRCSTE